MKYARLGDSGLVVSKLALGAMTFGANPRFPINTMDAKDSAEVIDAALDKGVNFIDTANVYSMGQSEEIVGKALGAKRREVVISTKVGMRMGAPLTDTGLSRRHILESVDNSLKRLNTDWIDLYIVHRMDPLTPLEETLDALDQVVRSGKARYIGFSNWPAWMAAKAIAMQRSNGLARFVSGQMYYSLADRDIEREIVPMALDAVVGLMIWSPLARGLLSGRYDRDHPVEEAKFSSPIIFNLDRVYDVVPVLRKIAAAHKTSVTSVAIAWVVDRPAVATVIVGASSLAQLNENLAAATLRLSDGERAALDEASRLRTEYPAWFVEFTADAALREALES
jgi:aryl-alcohol dehydrogenase-like predicted oxidoreductase